MIFITNPPSAFVFVLSVRPAPTLEYVLGVCLSDFARFIYVSCGRDHISSGRLKTELQSGAIVGHFFP